MRIAREIIETLRMELGLLKYKGGHLNLQAQQRKVNLITETKIAGFSFGSLVVSGNTFSVSSINIHSVEESFETSALCKIETFEKFESINLSIRKANFSELLKVEKIDVETFIVPQDQYLNFQNVRFQSFPKCSLEPYKSINFFSEQMFSRPTKIRNFELLSKRRVVRSNLPIGILCAYYVPHEYVERDKIFNALNFLKTKYNISILKFFAYYKDIPIEVSKLIKIAPSKRLFIQFDKDKLENYLSHRKMGLRNLLVFRYEDKFLYYPT
ncbi:MAG: hypothetical protein ABDH59_01895 [Fervidobacterium sp.]